LLIHCSGLWLLCSSPAFYFAALLVGSAGGFCWWMVHRNLINVLRLFAGAKRSQGKAALASFGVAKATSAHAVSRAFEVRVSGSM